MKDVLNLEPQVLSHLQAKIKVIPNQNEAIYLVGPINMPMNLFEETLEFKWYCWVKFSKELDNLESIIAKLSSANLAELQQSSVLVYGDITNVGHTLIRFHSICHTGDIFGSKRCDCGFQLKQSIKLIAEHGNGAIFYLANHEGRGIGLFSKALAYILQENEYDTVDANLKLGFVDDSRDYRDAVKVLKMLSTKPVTLITNNPRKIDSLRQVGLNVVDRIPLWGDVSKYNEKYLKTKIERSGHLDEDITIRVQTMKM